MFCHKCGKQAVEGAAFCSACGAALAGGSDRQSVLQPVRLPARVVTYALMAVGALIYWAYAALPWATDGPGGDEVYTLQEFRQAIQSWGLTQFVDGLEVLGAVGLLGFLALVIVACGGIALKSRHKAVSYGIIASGAIGLLVEGMAFSATQKADINEMLVMGPAAYVLAAGLIASLALGLSLLRTKHAEAVGSTDPVLQSIREWTSPVIQRFRHQPKLMVLAASVVVLIALLGAAGPPFYARATSGYMSRGTWFKASWPGSTNEWIEFTNSPFGGRFKYVDAGMYGESGAPVSVQGSWRMVDEGVAEMRVAREEPTETYTDALYDSTESPQDDCITVDIPSVGLKGFGDSYAY